MATLAEFQAARAARDVARNTALYGPRNAAPKWADTYARWIRADPADMANYRTALDAVNNAMRGTKYEGADPEHI